LHARAPSSIVVRDRRSGRTVDHAHALRPLTRALLWTSAVLVLLAGVPLFLLSERTETTFAWTIEVPLTAAFLGAAYLAAFALEAGAARAPGWAQARLAVPAVFVFTVLTLITTVLHLDLFHIHDAAALATGVAWLWIAVYVTVPVLLVVATVLEVRDGSPDPPRTRPLPAWMRGALVAMAVVLVVAGAVLLAARSAWWPWPLPPLGARAVGAWLVGIGVAAGHAAVEDDLDRIAVGTTAFAGFAVLQLVAVARYTEYVAWDRPAAWLYMAALGAILAVGLWGVAVTRRAPPSPQPATGHR
jgi:hypothetical protein